MDLNSLIIEKHKGPFFLMHFTKPWLVEEDQDVFFDSFANCVVLYKAGKFVFHDMHDSAYNQGVRPFSIHLATN